MTDTSTATVRTDRPGRYGKQLTSHMARKVATTWDDEDGKGTVEFGNASLTLDAEPDGLRLRLTAVAPDALERMEAVVGEHLVRFGARDELVVAWQRADGSPGTEQRNSE